ncbi:hypothetical protein NE236_32900 [Actinoallomurus purpureus]|uniref:hypothetical protein n=1 Tax=Actinoallomurus purpureus TaxID=478114 RepID=UPI0020934F27|nr:hypothetical protein [Actinoallomurus purpureus]MCO6009781.1 hypothetical protein [Actinoallomurus purpureus]
MRSKITALGTLALAAGLTTAAAQPALAQPTVPRHASVQRVSAGDLTTQANAKWVQQLCGGG